jgi:hypothetical protein
MGNIDALRDLKNLNLSHNTIEVVEFIPAFSKVEFTLLSFKVLISAITRSKRYCQISSITARNL